MRISWPARLRKSFNLLTSLMGLGDIPWMPLQIQEMETMEPLPDNKNRATLPTDKLERKRYPVSSGVLDYFPDAIAAVAHVSWHGNEQHNPGEPLRWSREKSTDQTDTMLRHFLQRGSLDDDGIRHSAKMAWRALAILQLEIEAEGK